MRPKNWLLQDTGRFSSGVRDLAELRFWNEAVPIRHHDLRQALLVQRRVVRQDAIQVQDVGGHRIGVIDAESRAPTVGLG
jgi:hypothetical protein